MTTPLSLIPPSRDRDEATERLLARVRTLTVSTREEAEAATDLAKGITVTLKRLDEERRSWTDPLRAQVDRINAEFKAMRRPLEEADETVRAAIVTYRLAEEAAAKAEAARLRELEEQDLAAAENARQAGDQEVADAIVQGVLARPDPHAVAHPAPVRGAFGTGSVRSVWAFEVEDIAQVPREWLTLDEKKVNAAIRNGTRSIPGLLIHETKTAVIR